MPRKVVFPYKTLQDAVADGFTKIGGPDKAYAYLVKGFKTAAWRRRAEKTAREQAAAEKEALMKR